VKFRLTRKANFGDVAYILIQHLRVVADGILDSHLAAGGVPIRARM
jgi:hypothetical protein